MGLHVTDHLIGIAAAVYRGLLNFAGNHPAEHRIIHGSVTIAGARSRCAVLKEPGRWPQTDSFMWLFRSGEDGEPQIVLYRYTETRAGYNAKEFLEGFSGYLMTDGYSGYNELTESRGAVAGQVHFFE